MRQLAKYSFEIRKMSSEVSIDADSICDLIKKWANKKIVETDSHGVGILKDGRQAEFASNVKRSSIGNVSNFMFSEKIKQGRFFTLFDFADSPKIAALSIKLAAEYDNFSPDFINVYCPIIVRDILNKYEWFYKETPLYTAPINFRGQDGGSDFTELIWNKNRSVPIVAVSDLDGAVLHHGIENDIASDLAGLALVVKLDANASWEVTNRKGKEWSCYGGAIRLYWPNLSFGYYRHSLWTPKRLLFNSANTEEAASRIRGQLRRRILGQSVFSISQPAIIERIISRSRKEEIELLFADTDLVMTNEKYFNMLLETEKEKEELYKRINDLESVVSELQLCLKWKDGSPDSVAPDDELEIVTVEDAVLYAQDLYGQFLTFGSDVNDGILSISEDAGPPEKIFRYLGTLAELTSEREKGNLGTTAINWLRDRNVIASGESDTILNSSSEMLKRTWDDGDGNKLKFNLHLKPSDATSPDRCVRIYFHYDEKSQKTIVGWVGSHPQ